MNKPRVSQQATNGISAPAAGARRVSVTKGSQLAGGCFRDPFPWSSTVRGLEALPGSIQLQLAPTVPTHLCEACWPRGRHSEVGLGALPPGVQIQIPGRQLQLIRARRGGGKPGIRLCPATRSRRGMVSPSPAPRAPAPASNRGATNQPGALAQPGASGLLRRAGGLIVPPQTLCRRF